MDDSQDWPARLTAPQRNHFFFGKIMGVAQFEREQRYGLGQRWLVNRLTVGSGVLCGLEVTPTDDKKRLRVAPGVAIDPWGREIVVARPVEVDPFAAGAGCPCGCGESTPVTEAKDYTLCLTYRECSTNDQPVQYADDCPDQPECQPDTIVETFCLGLSDVDPPTPFDCATWTRPGKPAKGETPPPPTIDQLRARLVDQLGNACAPPTATCVPLALVTTAKQGDGTWSLGAVDGPRRRIYTQAQLLEMILCLAKCCGGDHQDQPPPTDTLKIESIEFLRVTGTGAPKTNFPRRFVQAAPRQAGAYPPVFDAIPPPAGGIRNGDWDPILLRVTFNKAIEGSTVTLLPPLPHEPLGYELVVAPLDTPGGTEVATQPFSSEQQDANTVLMVCPGDPGAYRIIMRGDPVLLPGTPGLPAIATWDLDPAKRRNLDGEVGDPPHFPSGKDGDGGNFEYKYELRSTDAIKPFRITQIVFFQQSGVVETNAIPLHSRTGTTFSVDKKINSIRIVFNAPVDVNSVRNGLNMTIAVDIGPDPNDKNAVICVHHQSDDPNPIPFPAGNYPVTLVARAVQDVPVAGATARVLSGTPLSEPQALPTGGVPGADDFTFDFTVTG